MQVTVARQWDSLGYAYMRWRQAPTDQSRFPSGFHQLASQSSDDPIPLPNGSEPRTLRDAGNHIAKLPKRERCACMACGDPSLDAGRRLLGFANVAYWPFGEVAAPLMDVRSVR